ncbi:phospholipase D-like domain-containing protein [Mycoplasma sp. ATU-Cv-508]|uniref:phospholipase D-like domain-containing protein n=1 Tax=Mycoplasma sp. ATU-Cv-508 TaxID=2048001 RepID=UPI000FDF3E39
MHYLRRGLRTTGIYFVLLFLFLGGIYLVYFLAQQGVSPWASGVVLIYVLSVVTGLALFSQRRNKYVKLSWLLVFILLPLVGPLLFLLFGLRYSERTSLDIYRQKQNFKHEITDLNTSLPTRQELFNNQSKLSNRGIYRGNFEVFASGPQSFEQIFADIKKAQHFIHVNYYIIKAGEIYDQFRALIVEKVRAGVKVRMIIDDIGRWGLPWYEMKFLRQQGVEIRILNRIHFPFIGSNNTYRNHRKLIIIDGRIVHTGGANIGDEYANLDKRFGVWLDYKARITGPIVRSYSLLFLGDWNSIGPP